MEPSVAQSTEKSISNKAERPSVLARSLALMKPVTWFAPMWAFLCGAVASGAASWAPADIFRIVLGVVMAGPVLLGVSQVINDYFDREIDAINEPDRLIPSGMVDLKQVVVTILILGPIGVALSLYLGPGVALMTALGITFSMLYSAPPIRAKRNGWVGNALSAISYEGLAWLAGHLAFAALSPPSLIIAGLYAFGAHGIMSINDYKGIEGDRAAGIRTIPVMYGKKGAAWLIVMTMDLAQLGVAAALAIWNRPIAAAVIGAVLVAQLPIQRNFLRDPGEFFLRFSAIGVNFYVWGMLIAAIGISSL